MHNLMVGNSYNDEERCIVSGYDNGDIKLFDLRANAIRYETNVANGVTSLEFDRKDIEMNKLVVTTLESKFRLFDMRTQHPTGTAQATLTHQTYFLHFSLI
jgi:WD repeat-containing protein 92